MYRSVLPLDIAGLLFAVPALAGAEKPEAMAAKATAEITDQMAEEKAGADEAIMPATAESKDEAADDKAGAETMAAPAGPDKPVNGRIIHQTDAGKLCIGGVLCAKFCSADEQDCEPTENLTIKLDEPTRISTIQLSAHDNIGKTRRSRLVVKVNGKPIADTLVYKLGSTLSIDVGETGELITIESAHQYNGFLRGGEEAVIWDVYVFGGEAAAEAARQPDTRG